MSRLQIPLVFFICNVIVKTKLAIFEFLPAATKLGQGNVFTGVCDSVNRGVCLSACWDTPPEQTPPQSRPPQSRPPQSRLPWDQTPQSRHPPGADPPPRAHSPLGPDTPPGADPPGSRLQ